MNGFILSLYIGAGGFFGAIERDGDYGSSAVLKVASRPAMLA